MLGQPFGGKTILRVAALLFAALSLATLALAGGCTAEETTPAKKNGGGGQGGQGGGVVVPPGAVAMLEIRALDIWGQDLPQQGSALNIDCAIAPIAPDAWPVLHLPLHEASSCSFKLSSVHHHPVEVQVSFDGSGTIQAVTALQIGADPAVPQGIALAHIEPADSTGVPTHVLLLGLRHRWFSAQGRPARRGNHLELFRDGESGWKAARADIEAASDMVTVSTWWWESNFELTRDLSTHHTLTPQERWNNTILGVLGKSKAHKRVAVGQFWGQDSILSWLTTDDDLMLYADVANDGFEIMGQANPTEGVFWFEPSAFLFANRIKSAVTTGAKLDDFALIESNVPGRLVDLTQWPISLDVPHASYHQKFMTIDHNLAYVGGMNLRRVDWDTRFHKVFDHRRMKFDATQQERIDVLNKEELPDMGPRKDYLLRIDGPTAQDVGDVFQKRWDHLIDIGADYSDKSTRFEVNRDVPAHADGLQAQLTTTLPEPFWEHSIAENWLNAVDNAQEYIFIEDQYWRAPMLTERIVKRMNEVSGLRLVVITKPINEWADPGCAWTYITDSELKAKFGSRYTTLKLRSFDWVVTWGIDETESRYADMDIHSKLLIVDDLFLSVGSANKNNRGMVYEGEMNVAVLDAAWVKAQRRAVLTEILPSGTSVSDDPATWIGQLVKAAAHNDAVYQAWDDEGHDINLNGDPLPATYTPAGFVYGLVFEDVAECLFESVGPDMTGVDEPPI